MASDPIPVNVKRHDPAAHYHTGGTVEPKPGILPPFPTVGEVHRCQKPVLDNAPQTVLPMSSWIRIISKVYGIPTPGQKA